MRVYDLIKREVPQPRFELGFSAPEADALSIALLGRSVNFTTIVTIPDHLRRGVGSQAGNLIAQLFDGCEIAFFITQRSKLVFLVC